MGAYLTILVKIPLNSKKINFECRQLHFNRKDVYMEYDKIIAKFVGFSNIKAIAEDQSTRSTFLHRSVSTDKKVACFEPKHPC